ncbi:MAG: divalent cation transporter [Candidatus Altiarchaeales archaeon]|nr:divalent cation transporter [Candidatus Altiarchaeales archaeon]MBD3416575.1 divalent cation transporter [Candidatus Altiarchaeales archaeon]
MPSLVKSILKQSIPIFMLCSLGGVLAGLILEGLKADLAAIPGILILLPAVLGMRGNISGALGSRLASALHLGLIQPELRWNRVLGDNLLASLVLNTLMAFFSGVVAYFAYTFTGNADKMPASMADLTLIALIAGTLAGLLLSGLTISFALITYSRGLDPDNVLAPSLATVGDIITVLCLYMAIQVVA